MNATTMSRDGARELPVREALQAVLQPGEILFAFTRGKRAMNGFTSREFFIGLTNRRLILRQAWGEMRVFSIYPQYIKKVSFVKVGLWSNSQGLGIELNGEKFQLSVRGKPWSQYGQEIANSFSQMAQTAAPPTADQALAQSQDIYDLGQLLPAQDSLNQTLQVYPLLQSYPAAVDLEKQIKESKIALIAGGGILTIVLLFFVLWAVLGWATLSYFGMLLNIAAAYSLFRARYSARSGALLLALLNATVNIFLNISAGSILDVIMWISFGLAEILVLTGKPSRARTVAGAAIFLVGFIGVFAGALIYGMLISL